MNKKLELLAPGGDVTAIKAAIIAGANAIYCGLDLFNARNRAVNLSFDDLLGVIQLAHQYQCEVFLTLNIIILEHEIPGLVKLLNQLVNTDIDGIIVQDLGLFNLVKKFFPSLAVHASTQLTTHNDGQLRFLSKIGATRVNLSRELNVSEIKSLTAVAHDNNLLVEVFVHGALCVAFSGQCYSTSVSEGNSGNRGRCSQACRDQYQETDAGSQFPLNLKDNSAWFDLPGLVDAGVDSLKVEGRIKGAEYVHTVIGSWRQHIDQYISSGQLSSDDSALYKVFNRDFSNDYLQGQISKDMFINNPRDNSFAHATKTSNAISVVQIQQAQDRLRAEKTKIVDTVAAKVETLNIDKSELSLGFSGQLNQPFTVDVRITSRDGYCQHFVVKSSSALRTSQQSSLTAEAISKRFKSVKNSYYHVSKFDFSQLADNLSIPFKELGEVKNKVAFYLNGEKEVIPAVSLPSLMSHPKNDEQPTLSVLISDQQDAYLTELSDAEFYFKLPESFKKGAHQQRDILTRHPRLIPWFPAVLIGKDYLEAVQLLEELMPARIVTNNTGIAYKAFELGIEWIAGPFLNTTNSYALLTLQESLNCAGAFISNEISRQQIKNIKRPASFKLLYSIHHPLLMMTSRQCFFQQTVGCKKSGIDDKCMLKCEKATTITNIKGRRFVVDKQLGGYPSIYSHEQYLNLNAIKDFSALFDSFFIDLTGIGLREKLQPDKAELIKHFEALLKDEQQADLAINNMLVDTTNQQYQKGL